MVYTLIRKVKERQYLYPEAVADDFTVSVAECLPEGGRSVNLLAYMGQISVSVIRKMEVSTFQRGIKYYMLWRFHPDHKSCLI